MQPTLVVLAAGIGSRYGSLKQVDGLGPSNETIIDYSIYDALQAGFGKVVFVIRKHIERDFLDAIASKYQGKVHYELAFQELDMLPANYDCPPEREKPWGTAHAVWVAGNKVNEPFAVINADDFYGRDAFNKMAKALSSPHLEPGNYFMVGYHLANTLSDQGSVSRAICSTDKNGFLQSVVERTKIERIGNEVCYRDENGADVPVDENTLVSMNFWGFTPDFFAHAGEIFRKFLEENHGNPKAEFFIPLVADTLIKNNKATCKVLPTSASWFGVTYPGDKPVVKQKLLKLVNDGIYPSPLW